MTNLLPCPFCGRAATEIGLDETYRYRQVECGWCGATGPGARIVDVDWTLSYPGLMEVVDAKAAERWNTRPSQWVPCSERIPEPGEYVVVRDTDRNYYIMERGKYHNGWILDGDIYRWSQNITHWMPLEPPEVEP